MQRAYLEVTITDEGNYNLPAELIETFKVSTSIYTSYPIAELSFNDKEGRSNALLAIKPGNFIQFTFQDADDPNSTSFQLTPFVVCGIESPSKEEGLTNDGKTASLGGIIRLHLSHPWEIYTDWSNQGFDANISSIISSLVNQTKKGWSFSAVKIDNTDDRQGTIRYKLQESEPEFILNKLLPYASINNQAVYTYVNEKNEFHLHDFATMYSAVSGAVIMPRPEELSQSPAVAAALSQAPVSKLPPHFITDGSWFLGREFKDMIRGLKPTLLIEEAKAGVAFAGNLDYLTPIPGYTLVKKDYINSLTNTAAYSIPHRLLEDGLKLLINQLGILNAFLEVKITTTLILDVSLVGSPINILLASTPEVQNHWMNGKWVIAEAEHFLAEGQYFSQLTLIKPVIDSPTDAQKLELFKSGGS